MSLPQLSDNMQVIHALSDNPVTDDNLTVQQFKDKFDQAAVAIKNYLNNTLIPAIEAAIPSSITTAMLGSKVVTTAKIDDKAVGTGQIDDKAVGTSQLDDECVTAAQLDSALTYTAVNLNFDQVRAIKFGTDIPTTSDISDGEIYIKYTEPEE